MEYGLYLKFNEDKKLKRYLDENSYWIKELNRNPNNYKTFISEMKALYKERPVDKIENAIDTIDIVSSVLDTLK